MCLAKAASVKNQVSISADFIEKAFCCESAKKSNMQTMRKPRGAKFRLGLDTGFQILRVLGFGKAGYPSRKHAAKVIPTRESGQFVP